MKRQALRSPTLTIRRCLPMVTSGISPAFAGLSQTSRQITHVLRTLAPLDIPNIATRNTPLDLHVLSTPPAFVLSQNQTLRIKTLVQFLSECYSGLVVVLFLKLSGTNPLTGQSQRGSQNLSHISIFNEQRFCSCEGITSVIPWST